MLASRRLAMVYGTDTSVTVKKHIIRKQTWNVRAIIYVSIILIGLMMGVIALQNHLLVQGEYELWAMKKEWVSEIKQCELNKLEIAQLKAPGRIQQVAAANVGMVVPATVYQVGVRAEAAGDGRVADATPVIAKTN